MKLLEELKKIPSLLSEVRVKDLKRQNPDLEGFIDELLNWKHFNIPNKYFQWAVLKKKKENISIKKVVEIIIRFEHYISDGLIKAAKIGLIDSERQADISYWHKKSVKEFEKFLDKLENTNIDLNTLRKRKFNERYSAENVYEDDRVVVWFPSTHGESCEMGGGNWCIADYNRTEWNEKTGEGQVFYYVIDKLVNPGNTSEAFSVLVFNAIEGGHTPIEVWDYTNQQIDYDDLINHYGKEQWDKVETKIESHVSRQNPILSRMEDELWYGDRVVYAKGYIDEMVYDFEHVFGDLDFVNLLKRFYTKFEGGVVGALRSYDQDEVYVEWRVPDFKNGFQNTVDEAIENAEDWRQEDAIKEKAEEIWELMDDGEVEWKEEIVNLNVEDYNDVNDAYREYETR